MTQIEQILDTALDSKRKAKNNRDYSLEESVNDIQKAIDELQFFLSNNPNLPLKEVVNLNAEIADCYGVLGGIYRRWGLKYNDHNLLEKSYLSYDIGFDYEVKVEKEFPNSYNRLNRLIGRIFYRPEYLDLENKSNKYSDGLDLVFELQKTKYIIEEQLKIGRKRDVWALADLALIRVLLNEEPILAFSDFIEESPPSYVYKSLLSTIEPLSKINIPNKDKINKVIELLKGQIQ